MDQLRSPGGCAWDAEQTHASLARYLLEETYEVLEAIETDDPTLLREELGDLLLQILFHARVAAERTDELAFDIEDVAADLVAKLVRRHPHVFADGGPAATLDAEALNETWELQKILEKQRTSAVDGVPIAQPALALAGKLVSRAARAGLPVDPPAEPDEESRVGARLLEVVQDAVAAGVDPETALRRTTLGLRRAIRQAEATAGQHGADEPAG